MINATHFHSQGIQLKLDYNKQRVTLSSQQKAASYACKAFAGTPFGKCMQTVFCMLYTPQEWLHIVDVLQEDGYLYNIFIARTTVHKATPRSFLKFLSLLRVLSVWGKFSTESPASKQRVIDTTLKRGNKLNLDNMGLGAIPDFLLDPTFTKLRPIKELNLAHNKLTKIPTDLLTTSLSGLEKLVLSHNPFCPYPAIPEIALSPTLRYFSSTNAACNLLFEASLPHLQHLGVKLSNGKQAQATVNRALQLPSLTYLAIAGASRVIVEALEVKRPAPLTYLSLTNCCFLDVTLGETLENIPSLEVLSLKGCFIKPEITSKILAKIMRCSALKILEISHCQIKSLPEEGAHLTNLEIFTLSSNQLQSLPTWLKTLVKLKTLDLSRNPASVLQQKSLPPQLTPSPQNPFLFTNIQGSILAENNKFSTLTALLSQWKACSHEPLPVQEEITARILAFFNLNRQSTKLNLSHSALSSIPDVLFSSDFQALIPFSELDLSYNNLTEIPQDVLTTKLPHLKKLILLGNPLIGTPQISLSSHIEELVLASCVPHVTFWAPMRHLKSFPTPSNGYKNLTYLSLASVEIETHTLSNILLMTPCLETLKLNRTLLSRGLPEAIGNLKKLRMLDVASNELTQIPPTIADLSHLEVLIASDNYLTTFPSFRGMLQLKEVDISGNPHEVIAPDKLPWYLDSAIFGHYTTNPEWRKLLFKPI